MENTHRCFENPQWKFSKFNVSSLDLPEFTEIRQAKKQWGLVPGSQDKKKTRAKSSQTHVSPYTSPGFMQKARKGHSQKAGLVCVSWAFKSKINKKETK